MNNLTQTQQDAKQVYLERQQAKMLITFQNADQSERNAVIKQIDSFLEVVPKDAKTFWLKFRRKLENLNEKSSALFPLGKVYLTIGAQDALEESNQTPNEFLAKHQSGDFGIIGKEDWQENLLSIKEKFRILSAYKTVKGEKIWVISEADRSATTILLPSEY